MRMKELYNKHRQELIEKDRIISKKNETIRQLENILSDKTSLKYNFINVDIRYEYHNELMDIDAIKINANVRDKNNVYNYSFNLSEIILHELRNKTIKEMIVSDIIKDIMYKLLGRI